MQGPHRRKNCHQDIFQWTEEIAIAWDKLRAIRRVINKVPLKFQNSFLGFRSSMISGIFYAVSNPLLSRPSRFLLTESARVCRNVQYMPLTISTGFENEQTIHLESHKKSALPFPLMTQLQTFCLQVNWDSTIAWVLFWCGLEVKDPRLICWVCFRPQPGGEEIILVPVPFMSFCARDSILWQTLGVNFRKCRQFSIML